LERNNSFNFLRLLMALAVLIAHSFPLGGFGSDPVQSISGGQANIGSLAVIGFFAMSGNFVVQSAINSNFLSFAWKRFLRLFPAYWLVLLLTAGVLGPVIWVLDGKLLSDYWSTGANGPLEYFIGNWSTHIQTWGIYDIFEKTTPWGEAVGYSAINGSTWTLFWELNCYVFLAIIAGIGILKKMPSVIPFLALLLLLTNYFGSSNPDVWGKIFLIFFENQDATKYSLAFFTGATFSIYARKFDRDWSILVGSLALFALTLFRGGFTSIGVIALSIAVLISGRLLPEVFQKIASKNDYSYGIYLYAFPVQQTLAHAGFQHQGFIVYNLLTLLLTFACAFASWHLLEKQVLKLKTWGPGNPKNKLVRIFAIYKA
jgi:peptidoglycan/LPS O-acetylase OafA/YrhL